MAMSDSEYWDMLKRERLDAAGRVAQYNKDNPMTGNAFKDMDLRYATKSDRRKMKDIDAMLAQQIADSTTKRGQDITKELGLGEQSINKDKNRITEKGVDVSRELGLGEIEVNTERNRVTEKGIDKQFELGQGELSLNQDIFDQGVARYNKYGEPMDQLNVANKAMEVKAIGDDFGFAESDVLKGMKNKFLGGGDSVAKPGKVVDESGIYFDNVPEATGESMPDWLQPKDYRNYSTTGVPAIDVTLGAANEGVKTFIRSADQAGKYLDSAFGVAVPRPTKARNSLRRKVRKVN